ncbi:sirohydrochlorin ferrochelatase [Jatrophihabitans sp. GAS493]|uniref:sirohydrochlorin chelatase n=1 Tax=Jatrophihabitans sp. GAS493 TaxID=1907575 RepID=UPI000BB6C986|nr:CbiX/SirB N-terminal domain-containing protein [Jatrophihabitans sp. GAS493]SOD71643.1 sirohydrochlorin ferrochelatase [Jatrophihabitans sp. GAS493]
MSGPTLVAAAHGTASLAGQATIRRLVDLILTQRPDLGLSLCFLDVLQPDLESTLAEHPEAVVVPMLLSTGYHVLKDIPAIVAGHPGVSVTGHLGPDRGLSQALSTRLQQAETSQSPRSIALVAGGSTIPAAADDLTAAAADLEAVTGLPVHGLTLGEGLAAAVAALDQPVVATYLLAEGFFFTRLQAVCSGLAPVAPVIGAHPEVASLVLRRYDAEVSARL